MQSVGYDKTKILKKIRAANYLTVAQLFLQKNFLLKEQLSFDDIKPRLLGHWGTCPGITLAYNCLKSYDHSIDFVVGPGHGFPALQANLFIDGELEKVDKNATPNEKGIAYVCKNFSWPDGYPSHASPMTPHVICEGGELGYALATSYGYVLGKPQKTIAVLIGDGEFETATTLSSMNLNKLFSGVKNGNVLPILHLNGYKISAPTIAGRKSDRELSELIRGFGFTPLFVRATNEDADLAISYAIDDFKNALEESYNIFNKIKKGNKINPPFIIMKTDKGLTGPNEINGIKIRGNYKAHQIPLLNAKSDEKELKILEAWMKSYEFNELFDEEKGFLV